MYEIIVSWKAEKNPQFLDLIRIVFGILGYTYHIKGLSVILKQRFLITANL